MKERVCREGDEKIYQPKIHSERIRNLYRISKETCLPITVLVDYSIGKFIEAYDKKKARDEFLWNIEHKNDKEPEELDDLTDYLEPYQNDYGEDF